MVVVRELVRVHVRVCLCVQAFVFALLHFGAPVLLLHSRARACAIDSRVRNFCAFLLVSPLRSHHQPNHSSRACS
jgi:hypothetical protein